MKVAQRLWRAGQGWSEIAPARGGAAAPFSPMLVLYFAAPGTLDDGARFAELKAFYPGARLLGCTTGGEIAALDVHDGTVIATAIAFEHTAVKFAQERIAAGKTSFDLGASLARGLSAQDLHNVFLLSDGTKVNGTELVAGMQHVLGRDICLTGGLAGEAGSPRRSHMSCAIR